jgi:vacuolar protein sorting-associated protein 3
MEYQKVLQLEIAVVDGKVGSLLPFLSFCSLIFRMYSFNRRSALSILVHDLRDTTSAEAYCTLGRDVLPGKIAHAIGDKYALQSQSSALSPLPTSAAMSGIVSTAMSNGSPLPMPVPMGRHKSAVDEGVKKALLRYCWIFI